MASKIFKKYTVQELAEKVGGYYPLITLVNLRLRELKEIRKPLVPADENEPIEEIVCREIAEGKIRLIPAGEESEE